MSSKNATILLDDFLSNSASPTSRVYENPEQKIVAYSTSEVTKAIGEIENSLKSGFYVIVIFSYELGKFFNGLKINQTKAPLLVAWSFRDVKKFSKPCVDNWLNDQKKQECKDSMFTHQSSGICNIKLNSSEGEYANKIKSPVVILYGEDEIRSGKPTLRNLSSGEEKSIDIKELVNEIKKII